MIRVSHPDTNCRDVACNISTATVEFTEITTIDRDKFSNFPLPIDPLKMGILLEVETLHAKSWSELNSIGKPNLGNSMVSTQQNQANSLQSKVEGLNRNMSSYQHHHCMGCSHPSFSLHESKADKVRSLTIALALTLGFSIIELTASGFSHSLTLLADAGHMISDTAALIISLIAARISLPRYRRIEALAALVNSITLLALAVWIAWEAVSRLQISSVTIFSLPMLVTAIVGLGVNSVNITLLHKSSHSDLNLRGALLHVMADAASSISVILSAIAVCTLHWAWIDSATSLLVSGFIVLGTLPLIQQSLKVLLAGMTESDRQNQTNTSCQRIDLSQARAIAQNSSLYSLEDLAQSLQPSSILSVRNS